jgi:hypothetical protein
MARQRARGREAQRQAETEERILALRKEGRAWWIRGVLALVFGGLLGLLVPLMFAAGIIAFIVCVYLGLREGIAAQRLENG